METTNENERNEIEINDERSAFDKGIDLEKEFAEYVKETLGYSKIKIRFQVAAMNNKRGTNVDIMGYKLDERGKKLEKMALFYYIGMIPLLIIVFVLGFTSHWQNSFAGLLLIIVLLFAAFGLLGLILSRKFSHENIWVECKNLKNKVNINQVRKMLNEISEYRESGDKQYKFNEFAFVSLSGFVDNALELAIDNKIDCYIKEGNAFKKIDKWQ